MNTGVDLVINSQGSSVRLWEEGGGLQWPQLPSSGGDVKREEEKREEKRRRGRGESRHT